MKTIELFENIPVYIKICMKNKTPPLVIKFHNDDFKNGKAIKNFTVFWSRTCKEPSEGKHEEKKVITLTRQNRDRSQNIE